MSNQERRTGFSVIELLTVIAIISLLSTLALVALNTVRIKARDTKRKADLATIGRFLTQSCYLPDAGPGRYDLSDLLAEIKSKNEQYRQAVSMAIYDPKTGTPEVSQYIYIVTADKKCLIYANLENSAEPITLDTISAPTPGSGAGVFASSTPGWNGTDRYYQISN